MSDLCRNPVIKLVTCTTPNAQRTVVITGVIRRLQVQPVLATRTFYLAFQTGHVATSAGTRLTISKNHIPFKDDMLDMRDKTTIFVAAATTNTVIQVLKWGG